MLNLHRALFCTGIDLDKIIQIDCLAYIFLFSIAFHWLFTTFGTVQNVIIREPPPPPKKKKTIRNQNF